MTYKKETEQKENKPNPLFMVLRIFLILFIISFLLAGCLSLILFTGEEDINLEDKNVALIKINGVIALSSQDSPFMSVQTSQDILDFINTADNTPTIKAIVFEINSPGGTVIASKEIVDAIKKSNKTSVSWIREIGTSGAYWAASATDHIIADDLSILGSIGVYGSYLDFSGLLKDYNVTYNRLVAGEYKDMGSPLKELEKDEKKILQPKLDIIHDYFIRDVASNRKMTYQEVERLATGEYFLGIEAKENGLIDELGNYDSALTYISKELNITDIKVVEFTKPKTFFERLAKANSKVGYFVGRGIGDSYSAGMIEKKSIPVLN
jgi:protease IV